MRRFLSDRVNNDKMKSGRHERAWLGGGDPDRTGDPRLMSPLLCQLSYTATLRKEAAKTLILPEEGSQCLWRIAASLVGSAGFRW